MPFLLTMFGVLGGLAAFGLVGLFIGPVALAVAAAVWREWLEGSHDMDGQSGAGTPSAARDGPGV
jgi:predicted PurR-regulated permease PerM